MPGPPGPAGMWLTLSFSLAITFTLSSCGGHRCDAGGVPRSPPWLPSSFCSTLVSSFLVFFLLQYNKYTGNKKTYLLCALRWITLSKN